MFLLLTGLSIGSLLTFLKSTGTLHTQCHQKQGECITITSDANMNARISSLSTTSSQKDLTMPVVVQTKTEKPLEQEEPSSASTLEVEKLSLLEEEVRRVSGSVRDCLAATNLSEYFMSNGFMTTAEQNVRRALQWLRQTIPRFEAKYTIPCWNASLSVNFDVPVLDRYSHDFHVAFTGVMDGKALSFEDTNKPFRDNLASVHWTGTPPHTSCSVVCLPKVFVLGYTKCGSTFLYCMLTSIINRKLTAHGDFQGIKEPHWWVNGPYNQTRVQKTTLGYLSLYLLNFQKASMYVKRNMPAMTIDGTPNLMELWPRYSENETMENYCLLPSLIPVILPDSRYFVVMRNPITMLYSAFWWSCTKKKVPSIYQLKYKAPDIFHERVVKKISIFNSCKTQGIHLDRCVHMLATNMYSPELPCGMTRIGMGLYYFHTRKWLSVVPRERFHFFTLEELAMQDLRHATRQIYNHLELSITDQEIENFKQISCGTNKQKSIDYNHDPRLKMREDTRQILEELFQPYNQMLADLLGDDKFLWK